MGNNQGKNKPEETFDLGRLVPFGVYQSAAQDFDVKAVKKLITERKIAPYYKGLNDVSEIDTLLTPPNSFPLRQKSLSNDSTPSTNSITSSHSRCSSTGTGKSRGLKVHSPKKERDALVDKVTALYKSPLECPICFLFYPRNINYSACCDEPICTECLIQIKSIEGSSTPPSCPYCAHENFSVLYSSLENPFFGTEDTPTPIDSRPSLHKKATPVAIDSIRPEHLRPQPAPETQRGSSINTARFLSLRPPRRNRGGNSEYEEYLMAMQSMGVDLEELMMMEAIRVSLQEAEERERAQANNNPSEAPEPLDNNESTSGNVSPSLISPSGEVLSAVPTLLASTNENNCIPPSDSKAPGNSDSPPSPEPTVCEF